MVNLTPNSQVEHVAEARGSTQSLFPPRNHHNWGSRLGRRRNEFKGEPTTLIQLEERAQKSVTLMEKHGAKSEQYTLVCGQVAFDFTLHISKVQVNIRQLNVKQRM
ncbi:unnamed protein product, partial [Brenthis ino]